MLSINPIVRVVVNTVRASASPSAFDTGLLLVKDSAFTEERRLQAYEGGTGLTLRQDWDAAAGAAGRCLFREGAAAWAFLSGRRLSLLNPLAEPVTACRIAAGGESTLVETPAAPGAQRDFQLPFSPDVVQAYAGEEEVCVFTVRE